jgi:hypothetical protein
MTGMYALYAIKSVTIPRIWEFIFKALMLLTKSKNEKRSYLYRDKVKKDKTLNDCSIFMSSTHMFVSRMYSKKSVSLIGNANKELQLP